MLQPSQELGRDRVGEVGELGVPPQERGDVRADRHYPSSRGAYVGERLLDQVRAGALSGEGVVDLRVEEDPLLAAVTVGGQAGAFAVDQNLVQLLDVDPLDG